MDEIEGFKYIVLRGRDDIISPGMDGFRTELLRQQLISNYSG